MKNSFKYYAAIWAVLLVLFNVIAFVSVGWIGYEKYTPSFWLGYGFITLFFLGQLGCAAWAFKTKSAQKFFYNISVLRHSYNGLILSFVVGGACMLISPLPWWIGTLVCAIVLASNVLTVIKTAAAIERVEEIDHNIQTSTAFIKAMTAEADGLMARAHSDQAKTACTQVYEAFRYSDPVSEPEVDQLERTIRQQFQAFCTAVAADDAEQIKSCSDELQALLTQRNNRCKAAR